MHTNGDTLTFLYNPGFEVGDAVSVGGRTGIVIGSTATTITLRWPRWYERAWRWLVSLLRCWVR